MSSTSRGGQRIAFDVYETPEWAVHRLLDELQRRHEATRIGERLGPLQALFQKGMPTARWREPCAGRGNIIRAVDRWRTKRNLASPFWLACEIREDCEAVLQTIANQTYIGDWLQAPSDHVHLSITNPPFADAMAFIRKTVAESEHAIHLLRLNFLGSEERSDFIRLTTPDIYILPNRCEFAMAVRCKGHWARPVPPATKPTQTKAACAWKDVLPLAGPRPTACPQCDGRVQISTTDSVEYAWFHWWAGAAGHYTMLESTPIEERRTKTLDEDPGIE